MGKRSFGELEQAILKIFESGKSLTVREVLDQLDQEDKYTSVMTVMQRLAVKGVLTREREGRSDVYTLLQRPSFSTRLLTSFKQAFFKMPTQLLARRLMHGMEEMDEEELLEMENWIRAKRLEKQEENKGKTP